MNAPQTQTFAVLPEHEGQRLDKWLGLQPGVDSRSRAAQLIERGLVTLGGKVAKASLRVHAGQAFTVRFPTREATELMPLERPLDLVYQDDDVVVVNKPAGLVVHPAAGHAQDTLVNILLHHVGQLSMGFNEQRPGIVHRLDRDTSGLLVVAKNDAAHRSLAAQFKSKTTHRIYHALVHGRPRPERGTIQSRLGRHPTDRKRFASVPGENGKVAITHYETVQTVPANLSLIRLRLETGRTHQIRVHLSEKGAPLVGDVIYGFKNRKAADLELGRLALHAAELGFEHPRTGDRLSFKAKWPEPLAGFARDKGFKDVSD